ncbi:MAG: DHH family phosphoesterase [Bacteroidales bacterium]|nr:DHH family phosphoesterase [Bacteroidales bacterium]
MISKIIDENLIQRIDQMMLKCSSFVIVGHENPDGDAMGSTLALAHFLRSLGKEQVQVIMPNAFPDNLSWLPGAENVLVYTKEAEACRQYLTQADVIFFLDLNELSRTGKMAPCFEGLMAYRIMIDHHEHPDSFAHLIVSHPEISSTSELVFRLICRTGRLDILSYESSVCIYTGMMTDTGAFAYNSNAKDIYIIIYQLLLKGIDKDQIYRNVYYASSENRLRMIGYALYRSMEIIPEYHTSIMTMPRQKIKQFKLKAGDTDSLVNQPLTIKDVNLSVFLKEEDVIRISFRSIGNIPVNRLARELFGGGGHLNAAGGRHQGSLQEAVQIVREALPGFFASLAE